MSIRAPHSKRRRAQRRWPILRFDALDREPLDVDVAQIACCTQNWILRRPVERSASGALPIAIGDTAGEICATDTRSMGSGKKASMNSNRTFGHHEPVRFDRRTWLKRRLAGLVTLLSPGSVPKQNLSQLWPDRSRPERRIIGRGRSALFSFSCTAVPARPTRRITSPA